MKRDKSHIPHPMTTTWAERADRIIRLVRERRMSLQAATTVVDAAMFGVGCIEGKVRAEIQRKKDEENS